MNRKLLLIVLSVAAFSSCTTLYKSGQTPDDVYFSPVRPAGEEVKTEERRDNARTYNSEDRTIRFGINDRRWRYFDNEYSYNPYNYGFNYGYYYNPYFWPYPVFSPVFTKPVNPVNTTPRMTNLGAYTGTYNNAPTSTKTSGGVRPVRSYNNGNGSAVGNALRQVFSPAPSNNNNNNSYNNNNSNNNNNNNTRTYTPSTNTNSSSSSSGSSSGSGSVSRPPRGGGN